MGAPKCEVCGGEACRCTHKSLKARVVEQEARIKYRITEAKALTKSMDQAHDREDAAKRRVTALEAANVALQEENKRMFIRDFNKHPMVRGWRDTASMNRKLLAEQFDRSEDLLQILGVVVEEFHQQTHLIYGGVPMIGMSAYRRGERRWYKTSLDILKRGREACVELAAEEMAKKREDESDAGGSEGSSPVVSDGSGDFDSHDAGRSA